MPSLFGSAVMEIPRADESCDCHATHRCTQDRTPSVVDWQAKASGVLPDHADMGWWRCCRGLLRRRPRSVRRRMLLWLSTLTFIAGFLYLESRGLNTLTQLPQQNLAGPRREVEQEAAVRQPKAVEDEDGVDDPDMDLRPDLAPATLHYVWCGKRIFQYQHYLALRSANRAIKPDKLIFHYEYLPEMDNEGYYTWYNQTLMDIDHILPRPLNYSVCPLSGPQRYLMVFDILDKLGGIYVPEDALLVDFPVHLRTSSLVSGVIATDPETYRDGIIVAKRGGFKKPTDTEELLVVLSLSREEHGGIRPCANEEHYATDDSGTIICVNVRREIFPRDIWESSSKLSTLARAVAYGVQTIQYRQDERTPMPRIGHVVCINCEMRFITYLSILSALHVAGLNKVYVHGVEEPRGQWWEKLKSEPRVRYVRREYPEAFYDRAVITPALATGVMRVAILLKYGGVYMDETVVWTRRIPDILYSFDAVISPDWHLHGAWPESINHGAVLAKRGCEYMSRLRSVLQRYKSNPFWFNDHYMSYKILERRPHLAVLEHHLQVKCVNHNCHPTWQPNYRSGLMQNRPGAAFNWQNETLSIHWHDSFPELDPDMIKYTSGLIVQASRNVLFNAGVDLTKL